MPAIKVSELAYCRFQVPDLDIAEQFLTDFGLIPLGREGDCRYFRGTDAAPYCYVIQQGPTQFLGFAFHAKSREDLDLLAEDQRLPVETIDAPGGGFRVRLKEPGGYDVDVVYGIQPEPPIKVTRQLSNTGAQPLLRKGELFRQKRGDATPLKRLAHVVLGSPDVHGSVTWFHTTLGMISSDEVFAGPEKKFLGAFIRVDDGDAFVDHHALFVIASPVAGLHHVSFESQDIDAVLADHHYLKSLNRYEHMWGIGRHLLGSQVFDYWSDPHGYSHEHWADSDRLNSGAATNQWDASEGMVTQWGEEPPESVRNCVRL
ncbi:hypothetical protein [Sphingomonas sp.]|uniref:hypothetical protein n=1 Tax=Sphingomonas sp. TaxID=28214 RepID=UPI0025F5A93F|nr:hypothetical protein [Sphingomonas sp.]